MKARLTTLTPVHVGNGVTYNKGVDFIVEGNNLGIVDVHKVLEVIGVDYITQWTSMIERYSPENAGNSQPLLTLLEGRGLKTNRLERIASRTAVLKSPQPCSTFLKEHYRSALAGLTIPGSSLKGAIRTAILDQVVEREGYTFDIHDIKLEKTSRNGQPVTEWKFDHTDSKIFGPNANEKSTRFLKVGDIHFTGMEPDVYETMILNIYDDEWDFKAGQHFLVETIPAGKEAEFAMKLDLPLLHANIQKNPEKWPRKRIEWLQEGVAGFCQMINEVTFTLVNWELEVFAGEDSPGLNPEGEEMVAGYEQILDAIDTLKSNEFVIRIGANSGWIFMTAGWWRRDDIRKKFSDDDIANLRKKIQKRDYHNMEIWPKTRKISSTGTLFGFVKITLGEG